MERFPLGCPVLLVSFCLATWLPSSLTGNMLCGLGWTLVFTYVVSLLMRGFGPSPDQYMVGTYYLPAAGGRKLVSVHRETGMQYRYGTEEKVLLWAFVVSSVYHLPCAAVAWFTGTAVYLTFWKCWPISLLAVLDSPRLFGLALPAFFWAFLLAALAFGIVGTVAVSVFAGGSEGNAKSNAGSGGAKSRILGGIMIVTLIAVFLGYPTASAILAVKWNHRPTFWLTPDKSHREGVRVLLARVHVGMSCQEVAAILGQPGEAARQNAGTETCEIWTYPTPPLPSPSDFRKDFLSVCGSPTVFLFGEGCLVTPSAFRTRMAAVTGSRSALLFVCGGPGNANRRQMPRLRRKVSCVG